ncbi:MAG: YybS family protein [Deltaproteobacteria bacterium]|nr:YybS family protein [Deltaproteobacteria bacterium]MBW1963015.1 YybS family protein [Deltaproteobacteria bacterium]MBW2153644.1 YybS family protein [Deltaproteobacteria bacterium]
MLRTLQAETHKDLLAGVLITSLIFSASVYMPIIGFFCSVFIPLPILFYRSKLGRKIGGIIPVVTLFIMGVILGRVSLDLVFFLELMLLGFVLAELFEWKLSLERTVVYAGICVMAAGVVGVFFYSLLAQKGVVALATEYIAANLRLTLILYQNMGVSEENIQLIANSLSQIQYVLLRIVPSLIIASTLFVTWTSILMAKPILKAKGLFYPDFGPLNMWKPPDVLVWGVIGSGVMLLLPVGALKLVGLNGLIAFLTIYFFAGIAIVSYYFEKKNVPRLLRFFLYSLVGLQQFMLLVVIGLGFFDMWLNFRKQKPSNQN